MEKNKGTLITIILLLMIFIPCTIIGMTKHFEEQNKNHDFHYNGSLYFYDNDNLIGTYECKTNICDYAYYNVIGTEEKKQTTLINNQYAFINDGNKIYLEDIKNGWSINEYEELKAYDIPIENNSYITKNEGLWGIISMSPSLIPYLANKYEDIYLKYNNEQTELSLETVFVKEKEEYKIIKNKEEIFTSLNKIVECTDDYVVTLLEDETYQIVSYENGNYFEDTNIIKYALYDNYIAIWSMYNLEIYSINRENEFSINYLESYDAYADVRVEDNKLNVYEYDEIIDSYEL